MAVSYIHVHTCTYVGDVYTCSEMHLNASWCNWQHCGGPVDRAGAASCWRNN